MIKRESGVFYYVIIWGHELGNCKLIDLNRGGVLLEGCYVINWTDVRLIWENFDLLGEISFGKFVYRRKGIASLFGGIWEEIVALGDQNL